ncbi:hypothetical protein EYF80_057332 [Liparis tanakae]|uniref:Uncharacterized protein n=1 Tax=Liparis tanakae TaxID=230148 RepID=A0A4Z2EUN9_9TELE|nr:hypothetical protein EYF80_057332 [Liparis tanakae]
MAINITVATKMTSFLKAEPRLRARATLTVFQRGGVDLRARGPGAGSVEGLHHHAVLGELLQVVQGVDLAVPRGLHLHDAVLAVAARAVLPVTDLVTPDDPVLQLFPGSLENRKQG